MKYFILLIFLSTSVFSQAVDPTNRKPSVTCDAFYSTKDSKKAQWIKGIKLEGFELFGPSDIRVPYAYYTSGKATITFKSKKVLVLGGDVVKNRLISLGGHAMNSNDPEDSIAIFGSNVFEPIEYIVETKKFKLNYPKADTGSKEMTIRVTTPEDFFLVECRIK